MPASLSHNSCRGTAVKPSARHHHIPAIRSPVVRLGSTAAVAWREWEATITSTGKSRTTPAWSGISRPGNHRSHWICSPA